MRTDFAVPLPHLTFPPATAAPHPHTPIRGGGGADGAPHLPNLAPPQVRQVRQRGERPGPETVDDTDKGLSPYRIRQLADWYLERFEQERLATGTVQQDALDAELRAILAEDGVFREFVATELERVMVAGFAPLGSGRGTTSCQSAVAMGC